MTYLPLSAARNEIRLLQLSPAHQADESLRCNLITVSLGSLLPQYEAHSYVWGCPKDQASITLQDTPHSIATNLHSALRELRLPDRERCLWVDALCIDQSNTRERSEQVARMGLIYGQAEKVTVWLGYAWDGSELAMDFLFQSGTDRNLHPFPSSEPHANVKGIALDSPALQAALIRFFSLPWWTRVWTVQEIVLARRATLQCGQQLLDFDVAMQAVHNFFDHETRTHCCARGNIQILDLFYALYAMESLNFTHLFLERYSLIYNIAQYRSRRATDLRDKIFGMLGLGKGPSAAIIHPDYSLSIEEIFESTVISIIQRTGELEVLSHLAALGGERNPKLPSFVPDWSLSDIDTVVYPDWLNRVGHIKLYNACNNKPAELTLLGPGQIGLKGIEVDCIESCASVLHYPVSERAELFTQMRQLSDTDADPKSRCNSTTKSQTVTFGTTMCGGLERYIDAGRDNRPFYRRRTKLLEDCLTEWAAWFPKSDRKNMSPNVASIEYPFKVVSASRRFATTRKGSIGFVPEQSRTGDVVTILAGGCVPIVLRPLPQNESSSGTRYQVLGDAYIHGMMDGEVFQTAETEKLVDFVLV